MWEWSFFGFIIVYNCYWYPKLQQQQETFVAGFLCWLSHPRSREIWPQSQRPVSSCRITESGERRYFGHGLRKCSFPAQRWSKFASGRKNLLFDGFSCGRKPLSSRQGPDRRPFFCAAFTSYYEESDRGQTITTKKTTKSSNSHQKTQEYIQGKSPLFIL